MANILGPKWMQAMVSRSKEENHHFPWTISVWIICFEAIANQTKNLLLTFGNITNDSLYCIYVKVNLAICVGVDNVFAVPELMMIRNSWSERTLIYWRHNLRDDTKPRL